MFRLIFNFLGSAFSRIRGPVSKTITLLLSSLLLLYLLVPIKFPGMLILPENECCLSSQGTSPQEIIRFHVKAHSNRPEDQKIKNELAKMLVGVYGPSWGDCKNSGELKDMLERDVSELEETAQLFLQEKGTYHKVKVCLGKRFFPARSYGDHFYPAGEYDALYVIIGDGAGENWWCVLFPPLCFNIFPMKTSTEQVSGPVSRKAAVIAEERPETRPGNKWCFWLVEVFRSNK